MKEHFLFFVLEPSLASVSKSLQFYIASSDKVQWLGNRLWGALLQWYPTSSPSFSLSHSLANHPAPTAASKPMPVLSQDTHPGPLTHCHHPGLNLTCVQLFRERSAQSWSEPPGIHALEAALGSSPGPGPELAPGSSAPEAPQLLLWTSRVQGDGPSSKARPEEGDLQEGSPVCSRRFSHLADIQVLLQVIGVIELQDRPERSPLPALPAEE